jgi:excisionase family DNA binding protein
MTDTFLAPVPMNPVVISGLLTTEQAAMNLGVSVRTVKNLMSDGKLSYVKIGRLTRIDPTDIEIFIARNRRKRRSPRRVQIQR